MSNHTIPTPQDGDERRLHVRGLEDWAYDHGPAKPSNNGRLLTVKEAAEFVGCHANTIYLAAQSGQLRPHRVGRLRRFTVEDLLAWTGARR